MANKDVFQSYVMTVMRYDASNVILKRILTHIVNANQDFNEGVKYKGGVVINIDEDLFKDRYYTFEIKSILMGETDKNHTRVKKAFRTLQTKIFEFDNKEEQDYFAIPFITGLRITRGVATFRMSELIYKAFVDYTKGYRKFEFELSLSMSSGYSMRLYELISGQIEPLTFEIKHLKQIFKLENNYKRVNDFIRYVIEPAKKELDEKSPYTFNYKTNKKGRAYHSITFIPIYQPQFRDEELESRDLQKKVAVSWFLAKNEKDYLVHNFDFTSAEIKQHLDLFKQASNNLDLIDFLSKVKPRANRAKNPKGYVIASLKSQLKTT
jgi:plasmid replication initiation protein